MGFDLDADDALDQLRQLDDDWPETRRGILTAISEDLVGNIKRGIPVNTGRARGTVRVLESDGDEFIVGGGGQSGVDYIKPLLEGSKPHAPGSSNPDENTALARWARRNNYPGGFDSIYWSITRYGTEPHDFVTQPLQDTDRDAASIGEQVLRNRGLFE